MDITPVTSKERLVISHYGDGGFVINGTAHKGNILILPERVVPWEIAGIKEVQPAMLAPLAENPPEILLLGAGAQFMPVPPALRAWCRERNIAVDGMDTGAACRTYSVLVNEGRMVAAALIAV